MPQTRLAAANSNHTYYEIHLHTKGKLQPRAPLSLFFHDGLLKTQTACRFQCVSTISTEPNCFSSPPSSGARDSQGLSVRLSSRRESPFYGPELPLRVNLLYRSELAPPMPVGMISAKLPVVGESPRGRRTQTTMGPRNPGSSHWPQFGSFKPWQYSTPPQVPVCPRVQPRHLFCGEAFTHQPFVLGPGAGPGAGPGGAGVGAGAGPGPGAGPHLGSGTLKQ